MTYGYALSVTVRSAGSPSGASQESGRRSPGKSALDLYEASVKNGLLWDTTAARSSCLRADGFLSTESPPNVN